MRKLFVLSLILLIMTIPAFLFASSCGGGDEMCVKPTETDYYYIKYTLDGEEIDAQDIILNFDGDVDDPLLVWWPNLGWIEFEAFIVGVGRMLQFPRSNYGFNSGQLPPGSL